MDSLALKQATLAEAQKKLEEVTAKVDALKKQYDDSVDNKNRLRKESEDLEAKLARAEQLVSGLSGEGVRWEASIGTFEAQAENVVGDALVAAAFASYAGPFDSTFRQRLVAGWLEKVKAEKLPHDTAFTFASFLAKKTDVRDWNLDGLPADDFSTENGVIVTRGRRWPLMIDPQQQANKWIKKMWGDKLTIVDPKMKDFLRKLENAIQFGQPLLMQVRGLWGLRGTVGCWCSWLLSENLTSFPPCRMS
jgi:dynein heavy chain